MLLEIRAVSYCRASPPRLHGLWELKSSTKTQPSPPSRTHKCSWIFDLLVILISTVNAEPGYFIACRSLENRTRSHHPIKSKPGWRWPGSGLARKPYPPGLIEDHHSLTRKGTILISSYRLSVPNSIFDFTSHHYVHAILSSIPWASSAITSGGKRKKKDHGSLSNTIYQDSTQDPPPPQPSRWMVPEEIFI